MPVPSVFVQIRLSLTGSTSIDPVDTIITIIKFSVPSLILIPDSSLFVDVKLKLGAAGHAIWIEIMSYTVHIGYGY
jgi:hypothetical protein